MNKELEYIKKKKLTEKETFLFYIDIGYKPKEALFNIKGTFSTPYEQLCECIKILNEGWYPNWNNQNEYKYWIYFTLNGGFSYNNVTYRNTSAHVPSALCLRTEELANLASKILLPLYEQVYK